MSGKRNWQVTRTFKALAYSRTGLIALTALLILIALIALKIHVADDVTNAETPAETGGAWLEIKKGVFEVVCREDGELRPVKNTTIGFLYWGIIEWMIPEGTRVKKGDRLVSLETDELKDAVAQLQDECSEAEHELAQQEETQALDLKRLESDLEAEKDRLALARLKEKEVLGHPTDLEREEARNDLQRGNARLASAKAILEALGPLIEKGFAQRSDIEEKQLAVHLAEIEVKQAELKSRTLGAGPTTAERRLAAIARAQVENTYQLKMHERDEAVESAASKVRSVRNRVETLRKRLDENKEKLDQSTRFAPHAGLVSYRKIGWHSPKKVEVGDKVGPWSSPIDLPSYDVMKVRTQIPESAVRKMKTRRLMEGNEAGAQQTEPGTMVRVWVNTLPGKVYTAEVIWIDGWGRDRNATLSDADIKSQGLSGVKVYNIEVELKQSDPERLREGFRATVEFPVESFPDVIAIPARALQSQGGAPVVLVNANGSKRLRPVRLGAKSNDQVIIKEGLQVGERIWVPPAPRKPAEAGRPAEEKPVRGAASGGSETPRGPASNRKPGARASPGNPSGAGRRRGNTSSEEGGNAH